jgi:tetratricopeptide (TPR) repeat protein
VERLRNVIMESRYKEFSYTITTDPKYLNDETGITEELFRQMGDLHRSALKGGKKNIEKLTRLIDQYPQIPQLKNYLSVAWMNTGNIEKAREINHLIVKEHPDYLFGRLNLAFEYYYKQQFEKIPEVVGKLLEIQDLFPGRDCFHLSEVTSFNKLAIMYFCAVGNIEAAEARYEIIERIAPGHPDLEEVFPYLMKARLEKAKLRMEEEERTRIRVSSNGPDPSTQVKTRPEFANSEIEWLYENGLEIDPGKLKKLLLLPSDSLIADLRKVVKDSIYRFEHFKALSREVERWPDNLLTFPIHSIYLLGELRAEESLDDLLETLRQGEEFLDFWFGDFLTGSLWEPLLCIGGTRLERLKDFVLSPNIYAYARSEVSCCVSQIGLHYPERKAEVVDWYCEVFRRLAAASPEEGLIDSDFIGLAISDALDLRAAEILPEIRALFNLGYVNKGICGILEDVEREITTHGRKTYKKKLLNIFDRYRQLKTDFVEENEEPNNPDDSGMSPSKRSQEPGRNDPCPCGSGKKYKKCCLMNQV